MSAPKATVVVPTYGRPDLMGAAVRSVLAQKAPFAFEVVVVDDGGTPAAGPTVEALGDPRALVVTQPNGGPASARNAGLRAARGEVVVFLDDDCTANPGWLAAGVQGFEDGVVMVQGPVAPPRPASPLEFHFIETGRHRHDFSCNMFVLRDAALGVGGFDEAFRFAAGEDFDFALKLQAIGDIRYVDGASITHALLPIAWGKRRRRPALWESFFRLAALHPEHIRPQLFVPLAGPLLRRVLPELPPLHVLVSLCAMQFVYVARDAPRSSPGAVAAETAASVLNVLDACRRFPRYVQEYSRAQREREAHQPGGPVRAR
jgi:glycosyltransferase involved in cell wall biosynthesis